MTDGQLAPKVSVIIVSWNTADETPACIESVLAHDPDRRLEVVVVDNASTDDTVA
ncbi:MAG: glycosyltransferase family 2 protein, partial [Sciscionella sp.]